MGRVVAINEQRRVETEDGAQVVYDVRAQSGDEPVVVALHGVLVGTSNWVHQVLRMPEIRWIVPSLRGHGESSPAGDDASIEQAAGDVLAILDAEGVERAVIAGNSLGATVALALGLLHPERCRTLVLVEPSIPSLLSTGADERLTEEARQVRDLLAEGRVDDALGVMVVPRLGEDWQRKIGRRRLAEWRSNIYSAPAWLDAVVAFDPGPGPLAGLEPPALILYGANTRRIYRALTLAVADALPHADLQEIPDAGHGAPVDNPEFFNQLLWKIVREADTA
jgi:pimeloyl-ACP methyl ester carboxylesterase